MTDQVNTNVTTPEPEKVSYLNSIPDASTFLAATEQPELDLDVIRQAQTTVVQEKCAELSPSNPSVEFDLDRPLDSTLFSELVNKGYWVSRSSTYSSVNGEEKAVHNVSVSLPRPRPRPTYSSLFFRPTWYSSLW